jgi:hypothetical protein
MASVVSVNQQARQANPQEQARLLQQAQSAQQ